MAFDAGMLRAVLHEIEETSLGAKLDKISLPTPDSVVLVLKNNGVGRRLLISVGSNPRITLTGVAQENPPVPPSFCMLLRRHLLGARLAALEQPNYERVAILHFSAFDDMGYPCRKSLVAEVMGKYSNLILLSEESKILAALRIVDFTTSRLRQVLPGMTYTLPPRQAKREPLAEGKEDFLSAFYACAPEKEAKRFLTDTYLGTASQVAAEIVYRAIGDESVPLSRIQPERLYAAFAEIHRLLATHEYIPSAVKREDGHPMEFFYFLPKRYGRENVVTYDSFSALFDDFYAERDRMEKTKNYATDLLQLLSSAEGRILRKIERQREELAEAERGEEHRRYGDLITENIYRLRRGMTSFLAVDYTVDPPTEVTVPLDGRKSPAQNAQYRYKLYSKAKKTRDMLLPRIEAEEDELRYLQSVRDFLDRATTVGELQELREELYTAGYASRMKNYSPPKNGKREPIVAYTSGGYKLLCGRNNLQNDYLTFRVAEKHDLWFHVKGMPGSHVIMVTNGEEPPAEDYTEAAEFAAFHSKAKGTVEVDYTHIKNIKKPPSSKPGYVIYHTNFTAFVTPRDRKERSDD